MDTLDTSRELPEVEVIIEIPRWSFLRRGTEGYMDFISPVPCPFNYGSVPTHIGLEGDLLDALVLGVRLKRGTRVTVRAFAAIGLSDRGLYDDKLVCSQSPLTPRQRQAVLRFFHVYAAAKRLLNVYRGRPGLTRCEGWGTAEAAIARCAPRTGAWRPSSVLF